MRVGWRDDGLALPPAEAVRGDVYRDLRPHNKPGWSDITSTGPWAIDPGGRCDRHYHDCDEYWLIAKGSALVAVDGVRADIGPGDILCIERGALHDIVALREPLRAFWFEGPVVPGGVVGSLHRDGADAAGHLVELAGDEPVAAPASIVRRQLAAGELAWSDLEGAGSFELEAGATSERRVEAGDEYWLVREGAALVALDGERLGIEAGDVLCIEGGRAREVVEVDGGLLAFWIRRGGTARAAAG